MSLDARQRTQSAHRGLGNGGGRAAPTLGFEVITVLCTQNNWSHQCGCRTESLALPHHRCSPLSGQNPPIKSKQVAKRPRTPPMRFLPGERAVSQHLRSSQSVSQREEKTDGLARSWGRGFLLSPIEATSGNTPELHILFFVGDTVSGNISPTHPRKKKNSDRKSCVERRSIPVYPEILKFSVWGSAPAVRGDFIGFFFFFLLPNPFTYLWVESLTANWLPPLRERKNIISEIDTSSITEPIFPKVFTKEQFPDAEGKQTATEMCSVWGEIR